MKHIFYSVIFLLLLSACSSMTPSEVNAQLPALTNSTYFNSIEGDKAISSGKCRLLSKNRKYTAPIGFTVKNDLKNGAAGIDEWVLFDKGNSYILRNFKWVNVGDEGNTQLHVEFDTMLCE